MKRSEVGTSRGFGGKLPYCFPRTLGRRRPRYKSSSSRSSLSVPQSRTTGIVRFGCRPPHNVMSTSLAVEIPIPPTPWSPIPRISSPSCNRQPASASREGTTYRHDNIINLFIPSPLLHNLFYPLGLVDIQKAACQISIARHPGGVGIPSGFRNSREYRIMASPSVGVYTTSIISLMCDLMVA